MIRINPYKLGDCFKAAKCIGNTVKPKDIGVIIALSWKISYNGIFDGATYEIKFHRETIDIHDFNIDQFMTKISLIDYNKFWTKFNEK